MAFNYHDDSGLQGTSPKGTGHYLRGGGDYKTGGGHVKKGGGKVLAMLKQGGGGITSFGVVFTQ